MTIVELAEHTGKSIRTIQRYIERYYPEIVIDLPSTTKLNKEQEQKLTELLTAISLKEFSEKYGYSRFIVENYIILNMPDTERYNHRKWIITKEHEQKILKGLQERDPVENKRVKDVIVKRHIRCDSNAEVLIDIMDSRVMCEDCLYRKHGNCELHKTPHNYTCNGYIHKSTGSEVFRRAR